MLPTLSPQKSPFRLQTGLSSGLGDAEITTTLENSALNPNEARVPLDQMSIASFNPTNITRNKKEDRGKLNNQAKSL